MTKKRAPATTTRNAHNGDRDPDLVLLYLVGDAKESEGEDEGYQFSRWRWPSFAGVHQTDRRRCLRSNSNLTAFRTWLFVGDLSALSRRFLHFSRMYIGLPVQLFGGHLFSNNETQNISFVCGELDANSAR